MTGIMAAIAGGTQNIIYAAGLYGPFGADALPATASGTSAASATSSTSTMEPTTGTKRVSGSDSIVRVIGVSIYDNPVIIASTELAKQKIPWYDVAPWKPDELRRHYKLRDPRNPQLERPGIEFFDYNLEALRKQHHLDKLFSQNEVELKEWLDLFARSKEKTKEDTRKEVTLASVKKAYELLESDTSPKDD
jgi:hypothetical protein